MHAISLCILEIALMCVAMIWQQWYKWQIEGEVKEIVINHLHALAL